MLLHVHIHPVLEEPMKKAFAGFDYANNENIN
jgi:hypothetical protein